ncbi:MAG TPA: DNA primase [Nitrospirota bacterium]|nr:DNA primase [Nitrospirota bacterium]
MSDKLQDLKQRLPLLDYLQRHSWKARPIGQEEFVGLCPLHPESHPSFYVNAVKNVFYCHGCGRGGDLIRFVQLYLNLSFQETIAHLNNELGLSAPEEDEVLRETAAFYQRQLNGHSEAWDYLHSRGLHDPRLIRQLNIGYAPGGTLRRHLTSMGYSFERLLQLGLINQHGHDTFYRRAIFPCFDGSRFSNFYGRSVDGSAPHRFLPCRPKGGLFAWSTAGASPEVILVEGLFDLAVLWQAGFVNTTCAFGTHLTPTQFLQLSDNPNRKVFIAFDSDPNGAGQTAARSLVQRLRSVGLQAHIVDLPEGQDPNDYFVSGATLSDFDKRFHMARSL